jgi:hypothetical protein
MLQQSRQPANDTFRHALPLSPPGPRGGSPLPERLLWALEHLSGHDLSGVRVHRDSALPARMGARAFAYGEDIHLSPGAEDALAHEAWHVVQQREGRVRPTGRLGDVTLNDDPWLEREAEVMGRRAERLSTLPMPGGIRRVPVLTGPVTHPVVQRVVTLLATDTVHTANTLRGALANLQGVTTQNTPHLQEIVADLVRKRRTFTNLTQVKDEVKRRSFGLRHVAAMEALRIRQEELMATYMQNNHVTRDELKQIAVEFQANAVSQRALAKLRQQYGELKFLHWGSAVFIDPQNVTKVVFQSKMFKWLTGEALMPWQINCWETVLLSGGWSAGGARTPLYPRPYAFWADQFRRIPDSTIRPQGTNKVPRFVEELIQNPVAHTVNPGRGNRMEGETVPPTPTPLHPGMLVVFNSGQHVALATGRKIPLSTPRARELYGNNTGNEILEMDGKTFFLIRNTVEDAVARGYLNELHVGWLPECTQAQTLDYGDIQVQVAQSTLYT